MGRRAFPAALAFGALLADLSGHHELALTGLLFAIPASFALLLECYADALAAHCGLFRPLSAAVGLVLVVLSAALRSPAVVGGVPRLAVSALAVGAMLSVAAVARPVAPVASRRVSRRAADAEPREEEGLSGARVSPRRRSDAETRRSHRARRRAA
jgi:hypothetical protein